MAGNTSNRKKIQYQEEQALEKKLSSAQKQPKKTTPKESTKTTKKQIK